MYGWGRVQLLVFVMLSVCEVLCHLWLHIHILRDPSSLFVWQLFLMRRPFSWLLYCTHYYALVWSVLYRKKKQIIMKKMTYCWKHWCRLMFLDKRSKHQLRCFPTIAQSKLQLIAVQTHLAEFQGKGIWLVMEKEPWELWAATDMSALRTAHWVHNWWWWLY